MKPEKIRLKYCIIPLAFAGLQNAMTFMGTMWLRSDTAGITNITTDFDRMIPAVPQFVYIYLGFFVFWIISFLLAARTGPKFFYRIIAAYILADAVCLLFYIFLPTTNMGDRAEIEGDSLSWLLLSFIYFASRPTNLFPSTHCFVTWLSYICVRGQKHINKSLRVSSLVIAILIFLSTLFTKQHVFIDIPAGILLAEGTYILCGRWQKFTGLVEKVFTNINKKVFKDL